MEKRITYTQFQSVKAVAKACEPLFRESERVKNQIAKLAEKYKGLQAQITALETGVVQVIGFHVNDLVVKVKADNGAKFVPTDMVKYDTVTKEYVISVPDNAEAPGSDFDADAKKETPEPQETPESPVAEPEAEEDEDALPFIEDDDANTEPEQIF